jgi:2-polyprenyl-3-methyl-5-hydroxy-6-metoxy-1,4-benzoquinol methylase
MENNWRRIWENRSIQQIDSTKSSKYEVLEHLLSIDGFDSGTGKISPRSWDFFIKNLMTELNINMGESIFEVGCGAGAFLYPFFMQGNQISGIDFSAKLIDQCNSFYKSNSFKACEAKDLITVPRFDFVFSFSVFFYFPDLSYASNVLRLMIQKAKRTVIVLDVPDLEKKNECESLRRKQYPPGEYEKKYQGLNHLYYQKDWFREQAERLKCSKIQISDQNIEGYFNNKFRFNCILNK